MALERDGRANNLDELFSDLTPREWEVAALISQGLTNEEIARQLTLTPGTVANHVAHILSKTGARSRVQVAVRLVRRNGNRTAHEVLELLRFVAYWLTVVAQQHSANGTVRAAET